jgi:hypothetical protein
MESNNVLDKFGKFIVENLRDKGINFGELLLNGEWKAPALQNLQNELSKLSTHQKEIVKQAIISAFDSATHDFLLAVHAREDIQIKVDGENIVELSDGIHGEPYSEDGWYARFSKYKNIE